MRTVHKGTIHRTFARDSSEAESEKSFDIANEALDTASPSKSISKSHEDDTAEAAPFVSTNPIRHEISRGGVEGLPGFLA